ncbi:hypothetical protein DAMA08_001270 [Martiniozyma asiatica (nom. inval.)]|nr:hypothetical protein DAMA08_001270 [Martiniozyma asiatica]
MIAHDLYLQYQTETTKAQNAQSTLGNNKSDCDLNVSPSDVEQLGADLEQGIARDQVSGNKGGEQQDSD